MPPGVDRFGGGWLPDDIALDPNGFVLTGPDVRASGRWTLNRDPYLLETSVPGIFACGDVRLGPVKRVAAAVGEGSMAIAFVHQYLRETACRSRSGATGTLATVSRRVCSSPTFSRQWRPTSSIDSHHRIGRKAAVVTPSTRSRWTRPPGPGAIAAHGPVAGADHTC